MAKKKIQYYPIVFCGAFFPEEVIEEFKSQVLGSKAKDVGVTDFMSSFFASADFSQYPPHMKELIILHTSSVVQYDDEDVEEGYYIGVSLFEIPDHFSVKRICIDVRTLFVNSGFIPEDIHPEFVNLKAKVLKG